MKKIPATEPIGQCAICGAELFSTSHDRDCGQVISAVKFNRSTKMQTYNGFREEKIWQSEIPPANCPINRDDWRK